MAEKVSRAETWSRHLFGIIPEDRLKQTFLHAFEKKTDGFPVSAYDLNAAWLEVQDLDAEAIRQERLRDKHENPVKYCADPSRHINDLGEVELLFGGPGGIEATVPCPICRKPAYDQARSNILERMEKEKTNVVAIR